MNVAQRIIVAVGTVGVCLSLLWVPWEFLRDQARYDLGYGWAFSPPSLSNFAEFNAKRSDLIGEVNTSRAMLSASTLIVLTAGLALSANPRQSLRKSRATIGD